MRVRQLTLRLFLVSVAVAGFATLASGMTIATYNLTVQNDWSQPNHQNWAQPFQEVTAPHFSHLGGGTHTGNLTIWAPGNLSGAGMILMQETGFVDHPTPGTVDLASDFDAHIANGDAFSFLNYPQHFAAGSSTVVSFGVSSTHPHVTLVSMLGPTPDWFIGVSGLNMRDGNVWRDMITVDLFVYDGGTRTEDENFALFGELEDPQRTIALVTDTPDGSAPDRSALNSSQIGTFVFELQSSSVPEPSTMLALCELAVLATLAYGCKRRRSHNGHRYGRFGLHSN